MASFKKDIIQKWTSSHPPTLPTLPLPIIISELTHGLKDMVEFVFFPCSEVPLYESGKGEKGTRGRGGEGTNHTSHWFVVNFDEVLICPWGFVAVCCENWSGCR